MLDHDTRRAGRNVIRVTVNSLGNLRKHCRNALRIDEILIMKGTMRWVFRIGIRMRMIACGAMRRRMDILWLKTAFISSD